MIKPSLKSIPNSSGVYFFRSNRNILYIGKAANLRNRIRSYFDSRPKDSRIFKMLELADTVRWQETFSEIEALILESQLIKKNRPQFNIMLRDDKQYFFIAFTKEKFPRIFLTHQPTKQIKIKISQAIGPFTDGTALRTALKLLRRIFPYCTCKQTHNNYCLNYHIGKCLGFCCLKSSDILREQSNAYLKNIQAIKDVLNGKRISVIKNLEREMTSMAQHNNFERAIKLRGQTENLKQVFENAQIILELKSKSAGPEALEQLKKSLKLLTFPARIEGYDVSNIQGQFATGAMVVFTNGQPDKNEYRKFKIYTNPAGDTGMLQEILSRRFRHPEWQFPDLVLIDGGKGQLNAARSVISSKTPIIALTKNEKHRGDHIFVSTQKAAMPLEKLSPTIRNLILQIDSEAHRFAIGYYRKLHKNIYKK